MTMWRNTENIAAENGVANNEGVAKMKAAQYRLKMTAHAIVMAGGQPYRRGAAYSSGSAQWQLWRRLIAVAACGLRRNQLFMAMASKSSGS